MAYVKPTTGRGGGSQPSAPKPRAVYVKDGVYYYADTNEPTGQTSADKPTTGRTGGGGSTVVVAAPQGSVSTVDSDTEIKEPEFSLDPNSPEYSAGALMRRRKAQMAMSYGFMSTLRSLRMPSAGRVSAPRIPWTPTGGWTGGTNAGKIRG